MASKLIPFSIFKFSVGEKVNVLQGAYKGQNVIVEQISAMHNPNLYTCLATNGKEIALYENELQSMYQHDIAMLKIWEEIKDEAK